MVLGYHIVIGMYGFWLPNDPRGSWSSFVGSCELARFGPATKTVVRRSVARAEHDQVTRELAKSALKSEPVSLDGIEARAVAAAMGAYALKSRWPIWAFAILPQHLHIVAGPCAGQVESRVNQLKGAATRELGSQGLGAHRGRNFARGFWKVFLNTPADVKRAVDYVQRNPLREGKPMQRWSFVQAYEP